MRPILMLLLAGCSTPPDNDPQVVGLQIGVCPEVRAFEDLDGDGYGRRPARFCEGEVPDGFSLHNGDCRDDDPSISPAADEVCDGVDNDCDGEPDQDAVDAVPVWSDIDNDGYGDGAPIGLGCVGRDRATRGGDCDDRSSRVYPGAFDHCGDGIDADCDGSETDGPVTSVEPERVWPDLDAALRAGPRVVHLCEGEHAWTVTAKGGWTDEDGRRQVAIVGARGGSVVRPGPQPAVELSGADHLSLRGLTLAGGGSLGETGTVGLTAVQVRGARIEGGRPWLRVAPVERGRSAQLMLEDVTLQDLHTQAAPVIHVTAPTHTAWGWVPYGGLRVEGVRTEGAPVIRVQGHGARFRTGTLGGGRTVVEDSAASALVAVEAEEGAHLDLGGVDVDDSMALVGRVSSAGSARVKLEDVKSFSPLIEADGGSAVSAELAGVSCLDVDAPCVHLTGPEPFLKSSDTIVRGVVTEADGVLEVDGEDGAVWLHRTRIEGNRAARAAVVAPASTTWSFVDAVFGEGADSNAPADVTDGTTTWRGGGILDLRCGVGLASCSDSQ